MSKSDPVILDLNKIQGLSDEEEEFQLIIETLTALLKFLYTGRFAVDLTIYEIHLASTLAEAIGFVKLSKDLAKMN